jgi:formate dehydrogenase alpha subunit
LFAEIAGALGCTTLALREKANMQGLLDLGVSPDWLPGGARIDDEAAIDALEKDWCAALRDVGGAHGDVAELLRQKKIKIAVVLGEDPFGAGLPREILDGLLAADFLLVGDVLLTESARMAHAVLPLSSQAETSGTMTNQERRVQRLERAIPPRNGMETWRILCQLAGRMGYRFKMKYNDPGEITAEILRVVPLYRRLVADHPESEGVWAHELLRLPRVEFDPSRLDAPGAPTPSLALDHLEARFAAAFAETFAAARALVAATAPGR